MEVQPLPRAKRTWGGRDTASSRWGEAQKKPKCCKLCTQSQILPLRGKDAAETVLGWGADLAGPCL